MSTWQAPVRYAETDAQGIVFNAHYLLYCDEAMGAFSQQLGLHDFVERVRLKTTTLTWQSAATWGDTVDVDAACTSVGRTSAVMTFVVRVGERECCRVETIYVHCDAGGVPQPIPAADRETLLRE